MKNEGKIIRSNKTGKSKYTPISNEILQSKELTCNQKSVLVHLLSLPIDWNIYKTTLWKDMNIGRDSFNKAWKGLEELGYIVKNIIKCKNLIVGYSYIVYEEPVSVNPNVSKSVDIENTNPESGLLEIGQSENGTIRKPVDIQSNIEQKNNEENNNNTKDVSTSLYIGPVILGEIEQLQEDYQKLSIQRSKILKKIEATCQTGKKLTSEISINRIRSLDQIEKYQKYFNENEIEQLQQLVDQYWKIEIETSNCWNLIVKKKEEENESSTDD